MVAHTDSFYASLLPKRALYADPVPKSVDVVVLGGGLAGLSTAVAAVERGLSVVLCDSHRVGWGASGRNGGFVLPGFAESTSTLVRQLGQEHGKALHDLSREGCAWVEGRIAQAGTKDLIWGKGALSLVRHKMSRKDIDTDLEAEAALGDPVTYLDQTALQAHVRSNRYHGGFLSQEGIHINPLAYVELLATQARQAGVVVLENTEISEVSKQGGSLRVRAGAAEIAARHVVFCGSGYQTGVGGAVKRAVLPVATYMCATQSMPDRLTSVLPFAGCLSDTRRAGDYYRRGPDDRLLWGGRITTRRSHPANLSASLRNDIAHVFPDLNNVPIDYTWMGLMGYCVHKMPLICDLGDGLWANTGFGGHGLNTTAIGGQIIAEAISKETDRIRLFEPFKARWGGGALGKIATQLIYWRMRTQDRAAEKGGLS
ncbi:FAD-binding oxidoreductase [Shimia thalassica]|uniref:NAD(P)/FAD-dependent oxidoreductase n=1 Tax=Shimia thalassica TaxID=1715693 RepID=UPI001C0917C2|nr:FAD-binding oxidoreductase [Shimia thalassica]MBU2941860.1 FAD-binding oxidoreductase [Shimia thalassica]MDO6503758.1 FAD-binding oxidoreductase [Shimia thalassica]